MSKLTAKQEELCDRSRWDFSDLKAVVLNCTLKKSPQLSHTDGLIEMSVGIMKKNKVSVTEVRPVDFEIANGVYPDTTEHGWERDDWPKIFQMVKAADILIVGSAIWLGEKTSVCSKVVERLYAHSGELNDNGQYVYYGKVGGCLITGNDDGAKHCAMSILYALSHIGYVIPPAADAAWLGEKPAPGQAIATKAPAGRRTISRTATPRS